MRGMRESERERERGRKRERDVMSVVEGETCTPLKIFHSFLYSLDHGCHSLELAVRSLPHPTLSAVDWIQG